MPRKAGAGLVLIVLSSVLPGAQPRPEAETVTALVNVHVVNVRTGQVIPNTTIVVRDRQIVSVGGTRPETATVIDGKSRYVVPGLIDAHTHIADFAAARRALESGVTTVRSAGVSHYVDVGLRELARKGAIAGPDVLAAGYHVRPQLASEAFLSHPSLAVFMRNGITTPDALRQVVRANLSHGVDWIKTMATERAGLPEHDPRKQLYTESELRALVEEATASGIPVMAHAHGEEGALAAVKAGVRSIEHGTYLSDEALRLMKEKGIYLVPTIVVLTDMIEPGGEYDDPALRLRGAHMAARLRDTVTRAHRFGVKIVAGGDTGYRPQSVTRLAYEVAAVVDLGMTRLQALQAATMTAAELLRLEKKTAAIEPGLEADLVVVERNPLDDVRTLQDPLFVMSNGQVAVNRLGFAKDSPGTSPH